MGYTEINDAGVLIFNITPEEIADIGCIRVSNGLDASTSLSSTLADIAEQWASAQPSPATTCCCSFTFTYEPYDAEGNPDIPTPYEPSDPIPTEPPPNIEYEEEELSEGMTDPELGGVKPPPSTGGDTTTTEPDNLANAIEETGWFGSNVYIDIKASGNNIMMVTAVSPPTSGTNSAFSDSGFFHTVPITGASYGEGTYSVKFNDNTVGSNTYKINYISNAEGVPYCCNVSTPRIKQVTNNGEVVLIEVASYCTEILSIVSVTSTSPTSDGIWSVEDSNVAKTIKYTPTGTQAITTEVTVRCTLDSAGHLCDIPFIMYMEEGQAIDTTVVANPDTVTTNEDQAVTINVLSNDDPDASISSIVSGPLHGSVNIVSGQIVYTPAAGFSGLDSFTYEVTDPQGNTDTATVSVTVTAASTDEGGDTGTTYCCNQSSPYTLSGANDNTPVIINLNNYCSDLSNVNGVTSSTPASEGVWTIYGSTADSTIEFTPNNNTSAITSSVDVTLVKASDGAICTLPFTLTLTETNPNAGTALCTPSSINVTYNTSTVIFTYLYDYYPSANGPILNSSFTTKTENHGTWYVYAGTEYKIQYNPDQSNPGTDTCTVAVTFADSGDTCILDLSLTTVAVPSSYDNVCPLTYNISSTGTFLVDIVGQCSDITNLLSVGGPSEDVLFTKIGGSIEVTIKQMRSSGTNLIGEYLYTHTDGSERRGYITLSF